MYVCTYTCLVLSLISSVSDIQAHDVVHRQALWPAWRCVMCTGHHLWCHPEQPAEQTCCLRKERKRLTRKAWVSVTIVRLSVDWLYMPDRLGWHAYFCVQWLVHIFLILFVGSVGSSHSLPNDLLTCDWNTIWLAVLVTDRPTQTDIDWQEWLGLGKMLIDC